MKYQTGKHNFEVVAFVELIARYLKGGRIQVEKNITDRLTYHDPCQLARNGGVYEAPRYVIRQLAQDFVELSPGLESNWCCGGGGGLVAMGSLDFRMKSSRVKVDQVLAARASTICTTCENCLSQLTDLNEHYGMGMKVESLTNLTAKALKRG